VERLEAWLELYDAVLTRCHPDVARALRRHGIRPPMYVMGWVLTLFARPLGLECCVRVWDALLLADDPDAAPLRFAVGLASLLHSHIAAAEDMPAAASLLVSVPAVVRWEGGVVAAAEGVKLTRAEAAKLAALVWD
jgi:hypothetical protein